MYQWPIRDLELQVPLCLQVLTVAGCHVLVYVACSVTTIFNIYQAHTTDQNTYLFSEKLKVIYLSWVQSLL